MEDMIAQMKLVDGANKNLGWSNEITAWRLELAADKLQKEYNDTAIVGRFGKKLRVIEASAERAKAGSPSYLVNSWTSPHTWRYPKWTARVERMIPPKWRKTGYM
jgi:hypothetical protein